MFFWIIFLLIVLLCFGNYYLGDRPKPKTFERFGVLFIIVLMGIRFDIGFDYPDYYYLIYPSIDEAAMERIEPGSQFLMRITSIFNYPPLMFMVYSLLTYSITFYSLKKYTSNYFLAVITYLTFLFFISLGGIRQGLAISIIIYGIHFLNDKKYIKYSLSVIVATLFHTSAIVSFLFIPLYIIINKKNLLIIIGVVTGIVVVVLYGIVKAFFPAYLFYIDNPELFDGGNMVKVAMLILNIGLLIFCYRTNDIRLYKWIGISFLGCVFPFILGGHIGNRIAYYFYAFLCYSIPLLFKKRFSSIRNIFVMCLCLYFLMIVYVDSTNRFKSAYTPYQTIFTCDIKHPKWK